MHEVASSSPLYQRMEELSMTDELNEKIETAIMGVIVGVLWLAIYYFALFA